MEWTFQMAEMVDDESLVKWSNVQLKNKVS